MSKRLWYQFLTDTRDVIHCYNVDVSMCLLAKALLFPPVPCHLSCLILSPYPFMKPCIDCWSLRETLREVPYPGMLISSLYHFSPIFPTLQFRSSSPNIVELKQLFPSKGCTISRTSPWSTKSLTDFQHCTVSSYLRGVKQL